jgi:hypothetical protein
MQLFDCWDGSEFALSYGKVRYEICPRLNNNPEARALPAVKYIGQFFAHVGIDVIDEWYVPGELFFGEAQEVSRYNVSGRFGDIRGKPTDEDLKKIRMDALSLGKRI